MDVLAGYGSDSDSDKDTVEDDRTPKDATPQKAQSTLATTRGKATAATGLGSTTHTVTITRKAASNYAGSVHGTDSTILPPGWQQCLDPGSSDVYFWNTLTGETSWERPGGAPSVTASGGSSLLATAREEAERGAADVAAAEEPGRQLNNNMSAENTETQHSAVEDSAAEAEEQPSIPVDSTVSTDATAGIDDDFAAAAAAAEEAVKAENAAPLAQTASEQDVLHLAEVIGTKVAGVLKRLMVAKLNLNKGSVAQAVDAETGRISVFPPEPAPEGDITEAERARFRLLLQVKGMKGTGLGQLWKQRPVLEALERLQLLISASLLAWCKGELPNDTACAVLESYGSNLARMEEAGLPDGWRCIFRGADHESLGDGRMSDGIEGTVRETEADGHASSIVGFWYCHGRSGRATQTRPQLQESDSADAIEVRAENGTGEENEFRSDQRHHNNDDGTPCSQSQALPEQPPPPPADIEEQTWPGPLGDDTAGQSGALHTLERQDGDAVRGNPKDKATKTKGKSKRKSKGKNSAAGSRGTGVAHGKLGQMVEKWTAAKAEMLGSSDEEDDEGHEAAQASAARKRARELEEWRLATLKDPEARNNANFQPLQFDWRARLKRTRQEEAESNGTDQPISSALRSTADEKAIAVEEIGYNTSGATAAGSD